MTSLINKLGRTLFYCILMLSLSFQTAVAEIIGNPSGALNGLVVPKAINETKKSDVFDRSSMNESIDPQTGSLTIRETDISLTGRDGMDLTIGRIYNSSQAEMAVKEADVEEYEYEVWEYYYWPYVYGCRWTGQYTKECRSLYGDTYYSYDAAAAALSAHVASVQSAGYNITDSYVDYYAEKYIGIGYDISNFIEKHTYQRTRYDLGAGWSLAFPSVEIKKNVEEGWEYLYFHDGNGQAYEVDKTFAPNKTNLRDYTGNDVQFLSDAGTYSNGQMQSAYVFNAADKRKTYFGSDGRLLGIRDRFGNELKFTHVNRTFDGKTYPFIHQIFQHTKDNSTPLRTATFTYNDPALEINVTVTESSTSQSVSFKYFKANQAITSNGETWNEPILWKTQNIEGDMVGYEYDINHSPFDFVDKEYFYASSVPVALLNRISYPNSRSVYNYEMLNRNLGEGGVYEAYRVTFRHDVERRYTQIGSNPPVWYDHGTFNQVTYSYFGDITGYPTYRADYEMPGSYEYGSELTVNASGLKTKSVFNNQSQLLRTETTESNGEKQVVTNQSFSSQYKQLPTRTEYATYSGGAETKLYVDTTYNDWGGVTSVTQPLTWAQLNDGAVKSNYTTNYEYNDPNYKFVTKKDWKKNALDSVRASEITQYNADGTIKNVTDAEGDVTNYTYTESASFRQITVTRSLENNKQYQMVTTYDISTKKAYPTRTDVYYTDGATPTSKFTTTTYNLLFGNVASETDAEGRTTTYVYDNYGKLKEVRHPAFTGQDNQTYTYTQYYNYVKNATSSFFDSTNSGMSTYLVESFIKNNNTATEYDKQQVYYDAFGNPVVTVQAGNHDQYRYDALRRPVNYTNQEKGVTTFEYDAWGNVSYIDPIGNLYKSDVNLVERKTTSFLVAKANVAAYRSNPNNDGLKENVLETKLDQFGQTIERNGFPEWPSRSNVVTERFSYDVAGNLLTYTDPKQNVTRYTYNKLNRLTAVTDAKQQVTQYAYSDLGQLASITQSDGTQTWTNSKTYDELGQLIQKTDPMAQFETMRYKKSGLPSSKTDMNQVQFTYQYDQMNHLKSVSAGGTEFRTFYDVSPFGPSKVEQTVNGVYKQRAQYTYTDIGQLSQKKINTDGYNLTWNANYNKLGAMNWISDYSGQYTHYIYEKTADGIGLTSRIDKVKTGTNSNVLDASVTDTADYEYYPSGMLKSVTYPIGVKAEYEYDKINRLKKVTNTKGTTVLSQYIYNHDLNGNITSVTDSTGTTSYVYDELNRLIEVHRPNGTTDYYTYDVRGNRSSLTGKDVLSAQPINYTYSLWNELTSVTKNGITVNFEYNPETEGLRNKKSSSAGTTRYTYNPAGKVIAEANASNQVTAKYVWGPDRLLAKVDSNNNKHYYLYNGHGDVVQVVDASGNVIVSYEYDEWGNHTTQGNFNNPFRYAGEMYDEETGLYYLRARYYDPTVGRFINKDTYEGDISNPLSLNLYVYVGNNPLIRIDPTGHDWQYLWLDDFNEGLKQRANTMMDDPSVYNIGNWITMGGLETAKGAVKPEEPLSAQHWLDSAATAVGVVGVVKGVSTKTVPKVAGNGGVLNNANFAQKTYNNNFSDEGSKYFTGIAGKSIKTVDDLVAALKSGSIKPEQVPIDYIVRDGNTLILNTRSSQALTQAGIPRTQWNAKNRTGADMFEDMLTDQLKRNKLPSSGTSTVRRSNPQ